MDESVAIIGIGCRVPGADNIEEFWRVLKNGENHIVDIPDERWNNDYYYSETGETGKSFVKKAGLLKGHDEFDYEFFKISKGEAETIDPQQRLVLECTHMAFEDGGITRDKLDGSNTAVFVGAMNDDYKGLSNDDHDEETNYSATGMSSTYISARISHAYNLHGPCAMVDTACSSSMMAIHLGCQSIRTGESTMAVCGGANSILSPDQFIVLSKAGMLSRTGQCQTFCDTADGYARSEGCGIVILKSYKQALKDGDKIWGLIRTGTNQDGRTALSVAAPSSEQQLELLKRMYKQYNVDPTSLQYIEAHGTGTPVGDPVETTALGQFISSSRTHSSSKELVQCHDSSVDSTAIKDIRECSQGEGNNIRIGSVKTNIGHLESAAGAVSLIKVNLMMEHGLYVPSLHIKKDMSNLNKDIKLREHGLSISTDTSEWERNTNGERLACINSFGFGGSNVHAIVNQPRQDQLRRRATQDGIKVINISAQNRQSLSRMLDNLNQSLNTKQYNLEDIAYTSILKRDIYAYRLLVYGETVEEIQNQTQHELENIEHLEGTKPCHVIFVFCGVGTTWKGMCRNMMEQCTIFRSTIEDIDASLSPLTGWSISELFSTDTSYTNPLVNHISIFCCQVALFKTWEYYGVIPDAVIGQSVGEVAAAYASGSLSLEEAIGVIYNRSTALAKCTGGGMMVIDNMPIEVIEEVCKTFGDELNIAVYNSPVSCTISGSTNALEKLKHDLEALNQKYPKSYVKLIDVECAYHSSFTDKCLYEFSDKFRELVSKPFTKTQYSTVTGNVASDGDFQTVEYWVKNIRQPVKLMTAVQKSIVNDKVNVFLEIGPRPILRTHLKNIIPVKSAVSIASMNKNDTVNRFYKSVEKLYRTGVDVSLRKFAEFGNIVPEPRYVFNKTKLLHIPSKRALSLRGMQPSGNGHMFVRYIQGETVKIYLVIDQKSTPFVFEHYIFDRHLVPGSYYVEAAFEIGSLSSTMNFSEISVQVEFLKSVSPEIKDRTVLDVFESSSANSQGYREWLICNQSTYVCKISVKPRYKLTSKIHDISTIKGRCQNHLSKEESYKCLKSMHFTYGESLQLIHQAWSSTNECLAEFIIPDTILNQRKCTHIHPSVLDGLFQTFGVLNIGSAGQTFLPARIDSIVLNRPLEKYMFGYANLVRTSPNGKYFDAMLLTPNGEIIAEIKNFFLKHISTEQDTKHNLGYQLIWTESSLPLNAVAKPFELENVLIIGDRHIYDEFRVSETSDMSFIGWNDGTEINFENYRHIIVAALDTVDDKMHYDNMCVYNQCVGHFTQMKSLIEAANKHSFSGSIYVLTENVANKCSQSNNAIRVNGAELWGMVRSALLEYPYMKMHIVDIEVNQENLAILKKVIRAENVQPIECLIRQGKLFYSEIVALDVIETSDTIKSTPSNLENVKLKSVESNAIESPFFSFNEFSEVEGAGGLFCEIELESICLHDSGVYPLTADDGEDDCFDFNDNCSSGHTVICIEGIGVNRENKARVGFCWPSETCSRLSIPKSCTFDVDKVSYVPGLMSVALLLHNIAQKCTNDQRVHIVIDENTRLVQQMFSQCNCIIQTYDNNEATQDLYEANVLVLLTKLPCKLVKHLVTDNSHLECIITYKPFITRTTAVSIERNTPLVDLKILNPEDVFKSTGLEKTVPIVSKKLHLMNNELESNKGDNIRNTKPKRGHILHLPYKSLSTKNGGTQNVSIPLHVPENNLFRKNCCYVVVGGLSGLGWELLVYMAELGAGFIATIHRRCPSPEQKKKIRNIEEKLKCKIIPCNADVTNLDELNDTFKKLHKRLGNGVDVMGVLHGGGVLDDCVLEDMTTESIEKVLSPKVLGTLNLHQATKHMNLDFFIMHSSIVSITGNHGQCNYAAGNSFMDAFAMYRRSQELCGQSINWSALSVGMAMKSQQALKLERKGFTFLSIEEIRRCFLFAIKSGYTQVSFGKFDWGKLKDDLLTKRNIRKYSSLTGVYSTENVGKSRLRSLDMTSFFQISIEHRSMIVRELIYSAVKDVFVCSNIELSDNLVFGSLGIDSMASMHFINYIRQATNVELPMSILYADSTTIGSLCDMLLEKLEERRNNSNSSDEKDSMHAKQLSEYLQGVVPFTQVSLLNDFIENRFTKNIMRQVDIEVIGDKIQSLDDWKEIFNHLLKIEPDLRRIFVLDKKPFQSYLIKDATISIEEVSFDCIGHSDVSDDRDSICMDITKDIPISIKIAISGERTRLRFFIHGLLGDLPAVTMIFHQFANIATAYATNRALPEPRPCEVSPVDAFREAFIPRANTLQKFWSSIQWKDVKPFTLGKSLTNVLDEKYWAEISVSVPKTIAETVIDSKHISIYNFITSAYMALLHKETHSEFIPLVTYVDMRGHVHDLHKSIISCSNGMPILGDFRKLGKVEEFLETSSELLSGMTQQSAYPYELILKEIQSEELRTEIGRHRIIMEDFTSINQVLTFENSIVNYKMFFKRHVYETSLHVIYDKRTYDIKLEFGYNSSVVDGDVAQKILRNLVTVIDDFIQTPEASMSDILDKVDNKSTNDCLPISYKHLPMST